QQRGLGGVADGHDEAVEAGLHAGVQGRQHSGHGSDPAVESDLSAVDDVGGVVVVDQTEGSEHGDGDAEVESGSDLRHGARSQVDRQMLGRLRGAEVGQGGAQAFSGLADRGVGQPDDVDAGQSGADAGLYRHDLSAQAPQSDGRGPSDGVAGGLLAHESTWMFGQWKYCSRGSVMMPTASMRVAG